MATSRTAWRSAADCRWRVACILLFGLAVGNVCSAESIALVKSYDFGPYDAAIEGFVDSCGNHISVYNLREAGKERGELAGTIVAGSPDIVVTIGVMAAEFASQQLPNVPILYAMVPNSQARGLTGDNIGGITLDIPIDQQFTVYRSMVADLHSLGVIYDPEKSGAIVAEARKAAAAQGMELHAREVTSRKQVPSALRTLLNDEHIDVLWMIPDDTVVTPESFKFLLLTSFEHNLPFLAASDIFVKVGALASLTPDYAAIGRQGCELATALNSGRISLGSLQGVRPAKVNLSINLKTADKIGLSISDEVIASAAVVYR